MKKQKITATQVAGVGLLAALVFASSYLRITIPLPTGPTGIHLGNVFCVLSGLLMGPWLGGAAAGIGSMFFDLTNPLYIASAPFTLVFKFAIGLVAGLVAYSGGRNGKNVKRNVVAAALGSLAYVVLYLSRSFLNDLWFNRVEMATALISLSTRAASSLLNAVFAVAVAVPLSAALRAALVRAGLYDKFAPHHGQNGRHNPTNTPES